MQYSLCEKACKSTLEERGYQRWERMKIEKSKLTIMLKVSFDLYRFTKQVMVTTLHYKLGSNVAGIKALYVASFNS